MTQTSNIFANPPSLSSDEALERLRHQLSPKESYYCAKHLVELTQEAPNRNYTVGSIRRYLTTKYCVIAGCYSYADFVVQA